ncbi:MAG: hypothetical protein J7577_17470 [Sphingobacteriaceae bacterium]|nr:hypothetical protein [Sphingobacteriaceae bacterium]
MSCSSAVFSQQVLGDFTNLENFEWPKVIWQRDIPAGWDEGLIKTPPASNGVARSGFGIHMHESRQFSFWSTGLQPLLTIEGGSGNTYIKGNVGIGISLPQAKLQVNGGAIVVGTNSVVTNADGHISIGSITEDSNPTQADWVPNSTLLLNAKDYSTVAFHDSGSRVDFIRAGNGTIQLGYDGGWGSANIGLPNGIWNAQGNVGIGTLVPKEKLSVNGNIRAKEIKVEATNWPDYVFQKEYSLTPLPEVEKYINTNGHLPEIPSALEVQKEGIALGELNNTLVKKIEELTLHLIEQNKSIIKQNEKLLQQDKRINLLQAQLNRNKKKNK